MYSPFSFSFSLCFVKYRITMKIAQFYDSFCLVNTLSRVLRSQSRKSARASERAKEVSEWVTFQWSLRSGVFSTIFHFYSLNNNFLMATNSEAHYSIVCKFHASGSQGKKKSIKCLALRIWCKAKLQANEQQQQRNDSSHTNTHINTHTDRNLWCKRAPQTPVRTFALIKFIFCYYLFSSVANGCRSEKRTNLIYIIHTNICVRYRDELRALLVALCRIYTSPMPAHLIWSPRI